MTKPIASQTKKRIQVMTKSPAIRATQRTTEISGNKGTIGTRKPRGRSGCDRRRNNTPRDTRTNAKSVPMLERSAASPISTNPAGIPTAAPAIQVDQCGVLKVLCKVEKNPGSKPSRDMANQMRVCPYWKTSNEEIMPISAPTTIIVWDQRFAPKCESAYATGALTASALLPAKV